MREEFLQKLRATFRQEAEEHLLAISSGLLQFEAADADVRRKAVESVFRAAHSLKGAARAVDFTEIESLCQALEDVLAAMRRRPESAATPEVLDVLHRATDAVHAIFAASFDGRTALASPDIQSLCALLRTIAEAIGAGGAAPSLRPPPAAEPEMRPAASTTRAEEAIKPHPAPALTIEEANAHPEATVRIAVSRLQSHLLDAEELLAAKLAAQQRVIDMREVSTTFDIWQAVWATIEPDARKLRQLTHEQGLIADRLTRLIGFFDWTRDSLKTIQDKANALTRAAERDRYTTARLVDDVIDHSKQLLMLPFATISAAFPKLIRDIARALGKEVEFTIRGEEVQLDRRILEEIKDPLVHLLRNAVDHGVEPPHVRAGAGKPARATVRVSVAQLSAGQVEIVIADDGAGLDTHKLKRSAIERGHIKETDASEMSESDAFNLIFLPEVSTSPMLTELSGRGLGLAIVRERAEKLGGKVSVESRPAAGVTFRIEIPARHAAFRGILLDVAGRQLVIPTRQVEHVMRISLQDVASVEGRDTVIFQGCAVPLVRMADVLEMSGAQQSNASLDAHLTVVILGSGERRAACLIDAVIDEVELLMKPLRKPLVRVRNIAGAAILASGRVAPVLNADDLLESARFVVGTSSLPRSAAQHAERKRILVAEDSITSRILLKTILESAGYAVRTAIDGMEAFTLLRTEPFDLVVSDVEMPRLSGFDLTARIRADRALAEIPIILVTALQTREDRERGIEVGADAYLVKSRFDQSNLIEAVRRLV